MNAKRDPEKIFEEDEMVLLPVNIRWTPEELFAQEGVFFLKDVVKILPVDPIKIKKKAREVLDQGRDPWEVMGTRKVWNHWIVRMKLFGPYYKRNLAPKVRAVESHWDGNTLLAQKGLFYLTEVCKLIPFSTHQIRYQAKRTPNAREVLGVYKDKDIKNFVVDMERFAVWLQDIWLKRKKK